MKLTVITTCAAAAVLALSLSACAAADQKAFYKDIEGCNRHYTGSVSAGALAPGVVLGADIGCDPLEITKAKAAAIKAESDAKIEAIKASSHPST